MNPEPTHTIMVFCDASRHTPRVVPVTNFDKIDGAWHERPASRAAQNAGTGQTLVGNTLPNPGWALDTEIDNRDIRARFDLRCRKCKDRPVPARREALFDVLDRWVAAGVSELSLAQIAASLASRGGTFNS